MCGNQEFLLHDIFHAATRELLQMVGPFHADWMTAISCRWVSKATGQGKRNLPWFVSADPIFSTHGGIMHAGNEPKVFVFFLRIKTAGFFGFSNLRNCEAWGKAGNIQRCVLEHVLFCRTVSKKLWNKNPWTYGPDGFTALNFQPNISQRCFRFFAMLSIEGPITLLLVVLFAHFIAKRPVSWLKKSSFRVISLKLSHLVVPERGWKHQNRSVVNIVITGQLESTYQLYQIIHQCTINVFDLPRYQQKSFELFSNEDSQPGGVLWCENQVDCCRGAITSLVSWLANWKTHSLTIHLKGKDFQWWNEHRGEMKETKDQACFFLCSWIVLAASVCVCVRICSVQESRNSMNISTYYDF